jgi:hypothetical protein
MVRPPVAVRAPIDRAWNAAVDAFANHNIPIRTIERSSGLIATDALTVSDPAAFEWADCGAAGSKRWAPTSAIYNVRVRGDSSNSTVIVTVRWSLIGTNPLTHDAYNIECQTTGRWENGVELSIKQIAEH